MVKKLFAVLLVLLLPVLALADEQVIDQIALFSEADVREMTEIIQQVEKEHQVDLVVLATRDTPTDYSESMIRVRDYADDFYDQGGYGMGEDFSGMLILLDMKNRIMWLSTGGVMIEYINDSREEAILDAAYPYLSSGAYGDAMIAALNKVARYMDIGREEGTFLYDEATGKRLSGIYNALTANEKMLAAGAGIGAAALLWISINGSYSLAGGTYSYDKSANSSVTLTKDEETFVRQYSRRTLKSSSSGGNSGGRSGGSGVHRSSSGRSHGGGGRRF